MARITLPGGDAPFHSAISGANVTQRLLFRLNKRQGISPNTPSGGHDVFAANFRKYHPRAPWNGEPSPR
jgi:hypothetical protein